MGMAPTHAPCFSVAAGIFLFSFFCSYCRCSALNFMCTRSRGAALWIGLNLHTASVKLSKHELRRLINGTTFNLVDLLAQLRKLGLQPSMQLQLPGTCIYSPSGQGSAHIVITVGSWVSQTPPHSGTLDSPTRPRGVWLKPQTIEKACVCLRCC